MASFFAKFWRLRFSIIVGVLSFIAFFFVGGTNYASGVLFNELLKKPCNDFGHASTETGWNSTNSFACTLNETVERESCNHTSNSAAVDSNCGGFGQSRGSTAWTLSVYFFFGAALSQLSSMLIDRFGPRIIAAIGSLLAGVGCIAASFTPSIVTFTISYGVLGGTGVAFLYSSSLVIVSNHWRVRGYGPAANGITTSGMGVGTAAFGPIAYAIIKRFQWRWYLRVVGFCYFGISALTLIVYRELKKKGNVQQKRRFFDRSLFKNPAFVFCVIGTIVIYLGVTVPIVHVIRYAVDMCVSQLDADYLVIYMGVGSTIGRLANGFLANHKKLHPVLLFEVCAASCAITIFGAPFITNYAGFVVFMVVYGLFSGGIMSFAVVLVGSIVRKEQIPQALGWVLFAEAPSSIIAAPIAGWLYDATCSYTYSFYFGGGAFALGFLVILSVPYLLRKYPNTVDTSEQKVNRVDDNALTDFEY